MRVLVLCGSPRSKGNTSVLLNHFRDGAESKGHTVDTVWVYDKDISGCVACGACKRSEHTMCAINDDFQPLLNSIRNCDCLVLAFPIYFGQVPGPLKCVIDRFYCFFSADFGLRDLEGKKFAAISVCGARADAFRDVVESYLPRWFGEFCRMQVVGKIAVGLADEEREVAQRAEVLEQVRRLGESL